MVTNILESKVNGYQDARTLVKGFLLEMMDDCEEIMASTKQSKWTKAKAEGMRDMAWDALSQLQLHD